MSISASRSPRQRENLCEEIRVRGLGLDADASPDTTERPSNPAKPFRSIRPLFLCFSSASFRVSARACDDQFDWNAGWPGAESNHRHADFQSGEGDSRGLLINHLQRWPAPTRASPRHNPGTPNLSSSHSRHSGVCGLIPFSAPNNQRAQRIELGNEDIFANASLRAQLCRHLGHSKPQAMLWMRLAGGRLARRRWPSSGSQVGGCEPRSGSRKIRFGYPAS